MVKLDDFLDAYLECAVWSELDDSEEGRPLTDRFTRLDFSNAGFVQATRDCRAFLDRAEKWIVDRYFKYVTAEHTTVAQAGHDFWLTRSGHGCGFWDGDWREPARTILTNLAKSFNDLSIIVGDDNKLYFDTLTTRKGN